MPNRSTKMTDLLVRGSTSLTLVTSQSTLLSHKIMNEGNDQEELEQTLSKLRPDQLDAIMRFSVQWNTNSKHCHVAQLVLSTVLRKSTPEELLELPNAKSAFEGLMPYTEKHFQRMNRLLQQAMFVEYTWQTMRLASGEPPGDADVEMKEHSRSLKHHVASDDDSSDDSDDSVSDELSNKAGTSLTKHTAAMLKNIEEESSSAESSSEESDEDANGKRNRLEKHHHAPTGDSGDDSDNSEDEEQSKQIHLPLSKGSTATLKKTRIEKENGSAESSSEESDEDNSEKLPPKSSKSPNTRRGEGTVFVKRFAKKHTELMSTSDTTTPSSLEGGKSKSSKSPNPKRQEGKVLEKRLTKKLKQAAVESASDTTQNSEEGHHSDTSATDGETPSRLHASDKENEDAVTVLSPRDQQVTGQQTPEGQKLSPQKKSVSGKRVKSARKLDVLPSPKKRRKSLPL